MNAGAGTDALGGTPVPPISGEVSPMTWSGTFLSIARGCE
jgi:hypothetical protein